MKVYLIVHITFPTQVDGDAVEHVHPVAVYARKEAADLEADRLQEKWHSVEGPEYEDYGDPYYAVWELEYHP